MLCQMICEIFTAIVLLFTFIAVAYYAHQAKKLNDNTCEQVKMLNESNNFTAITRIHQQLANDNSYEMRRYIHHPDFKRRFAEVTQKILGSEYVGGADIKVDLVLAKINKRPVIEFNSELAKTTIRPTQDDKERNLLCIVEKVLLDYDIIALPFSKGLTGAQFAAEAYRSVLLRTARYILPFVAIQIKMRGDKDYKIHYLEMLSKLNIININTLEIVDKTES